MAKTLQPGGIATNSTIEAGHVTQSIVAFTGTEADRDWETNIINLS